MENLPEKINPFRLGEMGSTFKGLLQINLMDRLSPSLANNQGEVEVTLELGVDAQGIYYLKGQVKGELFLQCQRCLKTFAYPISNDFLSGLVKTEAEAKELPSAYEPIMLNEDGFLTQDIVEDELIISLPIVPMHPSDECEVKLSSLQTDLPAESDTHNPFKVIEALRKQKDSHRNKN